MQLKEGSSYRDLVETVDQNHGVCVFSMGTLRDVHQAGKLGSTVVMNISNRLKEFGLEHFPTELYRDQWKHVIVYRRGSHLGPMLEAVSNITEESEGVLRGFAGKDNPDTAILRRIREMVCD